MWFIIIYVSKLLLTWHKFVQNYYLHDKRGHAFLMDEKYSFGSIIFAHYRMILCVRKVFWKKAVTKSFFKDAESDHSRICYDITVRYIYIYRVLAWP